MFKGRINGRVLSDDGGQYKALLTQRLLWQGYQSGPQSFVFSFSRLDKKCHYKKYESQYGQDNSQPQGKVNKEFACQSYSKYSFRDISKVLCCKISTRFINNYHQINSTIMNKRCQGEKLIAVSCRLSAISRGLMLVVRLGQRSAFRSSFRKVT